MAVQVGTVFAPSLEAAAEQDRHSRPPGCNRRWRATGGGGDVAADPRA
jgi:hypothetical protein